MAKQQDLTTYLAVPPEKRRYSYFQALYLSFFSTKLYEDVAKRWRGVGLLYLLFVIAVITIPWSIKNIILVNSYYNNHVAPSIAKLPDLNVTNGIISIPTNPPESPRYSYTVLDETDQKPFIVIDTTDKITSLDQTPAKILITRNKIIAKTLDNKPFEKVITPSLNGKITSAELLKVFGINKLMLVLTLYPTTVVILYIAQLFTLYIFSFIGIYLSTVFLKFKLKYRISLRLSCVAATPEIFVLSVFLAFGWIRPILGIIFCLVLVCYFLYAVRAYRNSSNQLVRI